MKALKRVWFKVCIRMAEVYKRNLLQHWDLDHGNYRQDEMKKIERYYNILIRYWKIKLANL